MLTKKKQKEFMQLYETLRIIEHFLK